MAKRKTKDKGLGDTVERVTKATGIKTAVKWLKGEDCGCDKRKEKLNQLFRYSKTECLTEDEHTFLSGLIGEKKVNWSKDTTENRIQQNTLLKTFNRVFNQKRQHPSPQCGACWNNIIQDFRNLLQEYK